MCAGTVWQELSSIDGNEAPAPPDDDAQVDSLWNVVEVACTILFALEVVRQLNFLPDPLWGEA
jgi:hypothetical protein